MADQVAHSAKPRAAVGIGLFLLYAAILIVFGQISGIDYDEAWDSTSNVLTGLLPGIVVGGLVIAVIAKRIGWFGWAMRDEHRIRAWWMLVPAAFAVAAILANFAATDWGEVTVDFFLATLVLAVAVGFAEEFVNRGVLLVGLRGTFREVGAWALSCLFFGLITPSTSSWAPPSVARLARSSARGWPAAPSTSCAATTDC